MNKTLVLAAAAVLVFGLGIVALGPFGGSAVAAMSAADDDPQAPRAPEQVSPADPATPPPGAAMWVCPRCGAECRAPMMGRKGRVDGPQLGAGPAWGRDRRPGRMGRGGDRPGRGYGMGRHAHAGYQHMHGSRAPRAMGPGGFYGGGAYGGGADMMLRHAADLKLTDEQIGKLERISGDTQKKLIDLRAEIEKGELEIRSLLRSGSDDMMQIKRHLDAVSKARAEIQETRIAGFFEARKVLTAEQKKMVKDEFPRLGSALD